MNYAQTLKEWARNLVEDEESSVYDVDQDSFSLVCDLKDDICSLLSDLPREHLVWLILFAEVWHGQA